MPRDSFSRLSLVQQALPRVGGIESIYVVGSVAKGTNTDQSDLDVLIVTKFPTYLGRFGKLMKLYRLGVDVNLVSASLISRLKSGQPSSLIPYLANYRKCNIVVHGKDILPEVLPRMDRHSFALYAFDRAANWVTLLGANSNSIGFKDPSRSRRMLLKRAERIMKEEAKVPFEWREFGARLKEQASGDMNPRLICRLIADMLEQRINDLRFSALDQAHYVLINLLTRRRFLWRTLVNRTPIQERYLRALFLLFKSGSGETERIFDAMPLVGVQPALSKSNDFGSVWMRVQRAVLEDYQTMMGLGGVLQ
ncbi:MAG: nucleotidyltransferase domain-containing protein [Thaumarchaeota archaeon]|nr:nucleotidyltransferase domain-containing protein [Nitrososphaerota archaeon]